MMLFFCHGAHKGVCMLKIAIASLFTKNTKYAVNEKIQGGGGYEPDGQLFFTP